MAPKRFLNVLYEKQPARIDTKDMEDISQVQEKVLLAFKEITVGYARVQLWQKTATENTRIEDLDDIPDEYYLKPKNGGLSLTIVLLTSPTPSRQASEISLVAGMI
jgi:hypothetical protein